MTNIAIPGGGDMSGGFAGSGAAVVAIGANGGRSEGAMVNSAATGAA